MKKNFLALLMCALPLFFANAQELNWIEDDAPMKVVEVTNAEEFLDALDNNTTVVVKAGCTIWISQALDNRERFKQREGFFWADDASAITDYGMTTIVSEGVHDGRQLTLKYFSNLHILGEKDAQIIANPRYAAVIKIMNSDDVVIDNLTLGHTDEGYCQGGVVTIYGGIDNTVRNCDLYGCGTYGIEALDTEGVNVVNTIIRDCSYGIMTLNNVDRINFYNCEFHHNKSANIEEYSCDNLSFDKCYIHHNAENTVLFCVTNKFKLSNSEIYHPVGNLGVIENIINIEDNNILGRESDDPGASAPHDGIGPR